MAYGLKACSCHPLTHLHMGVACSLSKKKKKKSAKRVLLRCPLYGTPNGSPTVHAPTNQKEFCRGCIESFFFFFGSFKNFWGSPSFKRALNL